MIMLSIVSLGSFRPVHSFMPFAEPAPHVNGGHTDKNRDGNKTDHDGNNSDSHAG